MGESPEMEPVTACVVDPASWVAKDAVRKTAEEATHVEFTLEQPSIVAWLVSINNFGVDAKNLAFIAPATSAVVELMLLTTPVTAIGMAVMTAMPSPVLPPEPRV